MQKQLEDAANLNCPRNVINTFNRDAVICSEHPPHCDGYGSEDSTDEHSDPVPVHKSLLNNSTYSNRVQQPTIKTETEADLKNTNCIRQLTYSEGSSDGHSNFNIVQQPIKTESEVPENVRYDDNRVRQHMHNESSSDSDEQHIPNTFQQPEVPENDRHNDSSVQQQPMFRNEGPVQQPTFDRGAHVHQTAFRNNIEGPAPAIQPTFSNGRGDHMDAYPISDTVRPPTGERSDRVSCCCGKHTCQSNVFLQKIQSDVSMIKYYVENMAQNKRRRIEEEPNSVVKRFQFPISTVRDFNALDSELRTNEMSRAQLFEYVSIHCAGPTVQECTQQGLKCLVMNEVAVQYNWENRTGGKIPMKYMYFHEFLLDVLLQKQKNLTNEVTSVFVQKIIKEWFRNAKGRIQK